MIHYEHCSLHVLTLVARIDIRWAHRHSSRKSTLFAQIDIHSAHNSLRALFIARIDTHCTHWYLLCASTFITRNIQRSLRTWTIISFPPTDFIRTQLCSHLFPVNFFLSATEFLEILRRHQSSSRAALCYANTGGPGRRNSMTRNHIDQLIQTSTRVSTDLESPSGP